MFLHAPSRLRDNNGSSRTAFEQVGYQGVTGGSIQNKDWW